MDNLNKIWDAYLNGKASTAEKKRLLDALEQEENNDELTAYMKEKWESAEKDVQPNKGTNEILFQKIKKEIEPKKDAKIIRLGHRRLILSSAVAASFIILFSIALWWYLPKEEIPHEWVKIELKAGDKAKKIDLPDGSKVWVNSASTLSYIDQFEENRQLRLSGEAYFEVAKNKAVPFKVLFGKNELLVTGTQFNIKAYPSEEKSHVHVKEGSVSVFSPKDTSQLIKDKYLIVDEKRGTQTQSALVFETLQGWTKGQLVFKDTPMEEVFESLERSYGVIILQEKTNKKIEKPLTVSYPQGTKLEDVMEGLKYLQEIEYNFISSDSLKVVF